MQSHRIGIYDIRRPRLLVSHRPHGQRQDGRGPRSWRGGSEPRSFRSTRWPSTAAWTSARPSRRRRASGRAAPPDRRGRADEEFSVARYVAAAEEAVRRDRSRGRKPLFVGGTPLYLEGPAARHLRGPAGRLGVAPAAASAGRRAKATMSCTPAGRSRSASARRLHPQDRRRVIRALEVFEKTGRTHHRLAAAIRPGTAGRRVPRVRARTGRARSSIERIDRRVEAMFAAGLVDEVRRLVGRPARRSSRTAAQAVGYREVIEHLRGERDLPAKPSSW